MGYSTNIPCSRIRSRYNYRTAKRSTKFKSGNIHRIASKSNKLANKRSDNRNKKRTFLTRIRKPNKNNRWFSRLILRHAPTIQSRGRRPANEQVSINRWFRRPWKAIDWDNVFTIGIQNKEPWNDIFITG